MDEKVEAACDALEQFAGNVQTQFASFASNTLNQQIGWVAPALNQWEVAEIPLRLARRLREAEVSFDEENPKEERQAMLLESIPNRVAQMVGGLPNLVGGGIGQGGWAFFETFAQWERILFPEGVWREPDPNTVPSKTRRNLQRIQAAVDAIVMDRDAVEAQLSSIRTGADLIGDLPVDAEMIEKARASVEASRQSATLAAGKSQEAADGASLLLDRMKGMEGDAEKVLAGIEDAYRATTSHALASAFNDRALSLRVSVRWWVGLLIAALGGGAYLGYLRVQAISELTKDPNVQHGIALIWVQVALGTLSLAAPLWLAWLATRQISQRFRLAEDYSFKASLATAYEGYRREAARIDEQFEKDLFGSALRHLDQEPLRFMADADHSSPYAELLSSPVLKDAMAKIPGFAGELTAFISDAVTRSEKPSRFKPGKPPRSVRGTDDES